MAHAAPGAGPNGANPEPARIKRTCFAALTNEQQARLVLNTARRICGNSRGISSGLRLYVHAVSPRGLPPMGSFLIDREHDGVVGPGRRRARRSP
jgi:hypothetical protein